MRPRIRTIKPEIWESRNFMALPLVGKLAFFCLISHADDEGRLKTDPQHASDAWMHLPPDEVRVAFEALAARRMIVIYAVADEPFIEIENWHENQKIDHPNPSRYPPAPRAKARERSRMLANARDTSPPTVSDRIGSERIGPEPTRLCETQIRLLKDNGCKTPDEPPTLWLVEADRLFRIDKRPVEEAFGLLQWALADPFWRTNILSMPKFRAKYDQLRLKREGTTSPEDPESLAAWRRKREALA